MRKVIAVFIGVLSTTTTALAHPAWGIVQDSRGNVFFSDTIQVWKIAPDGKVSLAVGRVHTHELCIDASDDLFGEHLWYDSGKWAHRVWRYRPDGSVGDVVPHRAGFLTDYSFVRDRAGNMYWAQREKSTVIRKRAPAGAVSTHATGDFRSVERMTATPDGTLYLMDAGDLRRVATDGAVTTVVRQLSGSSRRGADVAKLNYHMGLWTDREGRVYVAAARERLVLRVDESGAVQVVARSSPPWSPSGGLIDADGSLWILEYDSANAQRVRKLDRDGRQRIFLPQAAR